MKHLDWIAAVGLGIGCSPTLTGAACLNDCNCPQEQRCVFDGGHGVCADGPNNCGGDAGPALFGTFTLNGGIAKPPGNQGTVVAWDHDPAIDAGGSMEATVGADGTWQINPSTEGETYYLQGFYALNAGRVVAGSVDKLAANGQSIAIDVPTYRCTVWSELAIPGQAAYLAGLIADVPNITDGTQTPNATVTATDGVRPTPFTFTLLPHPEDPFDNGDWAWGPLVAGDTVAHDTYAFSIEAPGYDAGTKCTVNNTSLTTVPTGVTLTPNPWNTLGTETITFIPPLSAQASYLGIAGVTLPSGSYLEVTHPQDGAMVTVVVDAGTIGDTCSVSSGKQCTFTVISVHQTVVGPAINEATSSTSQAFNTTQN